MIYLGIDCGTQSTKTIALDADSGRIIASAAQSYDVLPGLPPGHLEQNPATWTEARRRHHPAGARDTSARGAAKCAASAFPASSTASFRSTQDGQVIRPAKLWCDTSTAEECDLIRNHFGGAQGRDRKSRAWTCCPASPRRKSSG